MPAGRLFVMGDHRAEFGRLPLPPATRPVDGTVSENMVVGRAVVIAWPFGHWRRLEEPDTFTHRCRRGRAAASALRARRIGWPPPIAKD